MLLVGCLTLSLIRYSPYHYPSDYFSRQNPAPRNDEQLLDCNRAVKPGSQSNSRNSPHRYEGLKPKKSPIKTEAQLISFQPRRRSMFQSEAITVMDGTAESNGRKILYLHRRAASKTRQHPAGSSSAHFSDSLPRCLEAFVKSPRKLFLMSLNTLHVL